MFHKYVYLLECKPIAEERAVPQEIDETKTRPNAPYEPEEAATIIQKCTK